MRQKPKPQQTQGQILKTRELISRVFSREVLRAAEVQFRAAVGMPIHKPIVEALIRNRQEKILHKIRGSTQGNRIRVPPLPRALSQTLGRAQLAQVVLLAPEKAVLALPKAQNQGDRW